MKAQSKVEIRAILKRNRGSKSRLSEALGVGLSCISDGIGARAGQSDRVDRAIRALAEELSTRQKWTPDEIGDAARRVVAAIDSQNQPQK